jgi:tetratricopeptide (TPR) repeat protein
MSLTGALRFTAVFARLSLFAALAVSAAYPFASCDPNLTSEQRTANFKQADAEGQRLMQRQEYSQASAQYQQAVCLIPDSPRAWYGLGVAQANQGELPAARVSLKKADVLQPTTPMPLVMQVRVNALLKDTDALKDTLRDLAQRFPANQDAHQAASQFLSAQGFFDLALAEGLRAQRVNDRDAASKVQLAGIENTVGAYKDASQTAAEVLNQTGAPVPLRATAAGIAGLSYEDMGRKDEAISFFNQSIALDPSQENSYLALADLYDQLERYSDAAQLLTKARSHLPNSTAILMPLGTYLIRSGKPAEGITVVRELIRRAPDTDEAYVRLAEGAHAAGNVHEELSALRQLKSRRADYPMIDILIARAMLSQPEPDYKSVLASLDLAGQKAPNDADIYELKARAYIATQQYEPAISALERCIELRPLDAGPYYQLARVFQKLGKTDLAREQFERVKHLEAKGTQ